MLPDAGAFELIFLAAVALIFVGPKDLPVLMRKVGQFLARMRGLAAEFRASFDEMARQSELDELRREVEALRNARFEHPLATEVNAQLSDIHAGLTPDAASTGALTTEGMAAVAPTDAPAAATSAPEAPSHPEVKA